MDTAATSIVVNGKRSKINKIAAVIPILTRPGGDVPHVGGYGRVSTLDQDVTGMSQRVVAEQHFKLKYESQGYAWGGWFCDGAVAAYSVFGERDAAAAIIALMQPGDVIMVAKADRFYKSLLDYAQTLHDLTEIGVFLYTCDTGLDTSTDMGITISGITAVLGQSERLRMSTRRREQIAAMDLAGLCFINAESHGFDKVFVRMLGTKKAYKCVPNLGDQIIMERLFYWHVIKQTSAENIARLLNSCHFHKAERRNKDMLAVRDKPFYLRSVSIYAKLWMDISETPSDVVQYFTPEERIAFYADHKPRNPFVLTPKRSCNSKHSRSEGSRLRNLYGVDYDEYQRQRAVELCTAAGKSALAIVADILAGHASPEHQTA